MDYYKLITIDPERRSGKPCIRDTRMTVGDVLGYLASGMTPEAIVAEFPNITDEDIRACLAFAADREKRIVVVTPAA
ncbi:MAG: DUF433 domain-containing protein [Flavobacteriales bacterium]|nr:DUF433 domain-containing protein [Flavobacteriales bacterium]